MQYQNVENLIDREVIKDTAFKDMVGHGRPNYLTEQDSFDLCQEYRRTFPQPAMFGMSNDRGFTDRVLMPTHYDFDAAQKDVVDELLEKYHEVVVTDQEVEDVRALTRNKLTQGEAIELILKSKIKTYKGLAEEESKSTGANIIDAVYDPVQRSTHYFL